jgi:hypothetical protein
MPTRRSTPSLRHCSGANSKWWTRICRSISTRSPARGWRRQDYQELNTTLRLRDESKFEWGARLADAEAERAHAVRLVADAQSVFMALLALIHHRLKADLSSLPSALYKAFQALAQGVIMQLETLANRVEGKAEGPSPALPILFTRVEEAAQNAMPGLDPVLLAHLPGRIAL